MLNMLFQVISQLCASVKGSHPVHGVVFVIPQTFDTVSGTDGGIAKHH